jgi:hypothetical protein
MGLRKMVNMCPVCGYYMEEAPENYNVCPSCGTEFGLHDVNSSVPELQAAWLRSGEDGPRWWSRFDDPPPRWDPRKQFERVFLNAGPISKEFIFSVELNPREDAPSRNKRRRRTRAKRLSVARVAVDLPPYLNPVAA